MRENLVANETIAALRAIKEDAKKAGLNKELSVF